MNSKNNKTCLSLGQVLDSGTHKKHFVLLNKTNNYSKRLLDLRFESISITHKLKVIRFKNNQMFNEVLKIKF